ncbi:hypothetical protein SAMN05216330_11950 [Bradyrhizobium sp. Ghvi]|nr:hypothetical protein SAMN05216330_11950 [Bradyrhizobium sp. Ghvi]
MSAQQPDKLVVGGRFKLSELGIVWLPEFAHKTGTIVETSVRTSGVTVLFDGAAKPTVRPKLHITSLAVTIFIDREPSPTCRSRSI